MSDFARSTVDWAWACDAALCITQLSDSFTAMTGLPVRQFIGAPLESLLDFAGPQDAAAFMAQLSRGEPMNGALAILKAETGPLPVKFSAVPIHTGEGDLVGLEGAVVSAQRKPPLFEKDPEEEGNLQLAHQVQHELRTPLNAIAGFAQIMREDLKNQADGRYAGYCDDILSASNHLLGLIDDMVTAYGAGQPEGSLIPVESDIAIIIDEVDRLLRSVAEKADVQLSMNPSGQTVSCLTDRRKLKQILVNLLENAVKFTPAGGQAGIDVTVLDDHFAEVTVWDQGPGIAPEDQEKIWQRYQKAGQDTPYEASSPGLGLGLSVVKALADGIGAQLRLESALGQGSRFIIRLPIAP
ncbi:MAG: HAMP domain-containing sensor histidine kinase [Pseudomonadota bacterium]